MEMSIIAPFHADSFAVLLRHYRKRAGLTQQELAGRSRLSVRAISDLERGIRKMPHKDTLALVIEALCLSENDASALRSAVRQIRSRQISPPMSMRKVPVGIPGPLTPIIGRERDVAAITNLLGLSDVRLLTLTGPAGIGKTRLAQQLAVDVRDTFVDGASYISLAPLSDSALVPATVAQSLGLVEEVGQNVQDQVQNFLAHRRALLILDNFEHLLVAASFVGHLLAACPDVKVLVTSRKPLHLRGEQEFAVPPLDTPDLDCLPALEDITRYAAVSLFLQRAEAVRPSMTLTPEVASAIAAITVRLDGLPLAIELAAARIKVLSPKMLLTHLDASLSVLTRGSIDLPERQQTMRRAIAWSYDLLDAPEQELFRRLAVFAGGWTLEAAEAVCVTGNEPGSALLDRLTALVDSSLVTLSENTAGEPRFRLLELIREFGLEQLAVAGEYAMMHQQYADYFVAFAEKAEKCLYGEAQSQWFARLSQEHANFRATLRWAEESGSTGAGLRLAATLRWFWQIRGHAREGRAWLEKLLALQPEPKGERELLLRADALSAAGHLAWFQGDYEPAERLLQESLPLFQRVESTSGQAHVLNTLGMIADERGDLDLAVAFYEEALARFRQLQDTHPIAMIYNNLGGTLYKKHHVTSAVELSEESLRLSRESGDRLWTAVSLNNLGELLRAQGDLTRAAILLEESFALYTEVGDRAFTVDILNNLGNIAHDRGDLKRAASLYHQGMVRALEFGVKCPQLSLLVSAASLACDLNLPSQSVRLFAAASKLRATTSMIWSVENEARYKSKVDLVCFKLGEEAFAREWEAGQRITEDEAASFVAMMEHLQVTRPVRMVPLA